MMIVEMSVMESQDKPKNKSQDVFKLTGASDQPVESEVGEIRNEIARVAEKFKDPLFIAGLMYKVTTERENMNRILGNINAKLDLLAERLAKVEAAGGRPAPRPPTILPEIDMKIMDFIEETGGADAEQVREKFKYKGKNAASSRLSRLHSMGLLQKSQAGKKVVYISKNDH
ncbi:Uncharacterised protein [Candidatus Gugararchaeum adminiculabundum]|nr:Uncharacterised protein [Candidatus Gugararchaeum adminiculabundum]